MTGDLRSRATGQQHGEPVGQALLADQIGDPHEQGRSGDRRRDHHQPPGRAVGGDAHPRIGTLHALHPPEGEERLNAGQDERERPHPPPEARASLGAGVTKRPPARNDQRGDLDQQKSAQHGVQAQREQPELGGIEVNTGALERIEVQHRKRPAADRRHRQRRQQSYRQPSPRDTLRLRHPAMVRHLATPGWGSNGFKRSRPPPERRAQARSVGP